MVCGIFIGIVEFCSVLAEDFLALFAGQDDLSVLVDLVVLALSMALGAVEPELAALGSDLDLGVQNVFAHSFLFFFEFKFN